MTVRSCLLLLVMFAAGDSLAGTGCRRELLGADETAQIATLVMRQTGIAANLATLEACKDDHTVWLDTFRVPQKDGASRWFQLWCSPVESLADRWHCIQYGHYGFRADTYPGELGVWVDVLEKSDLAGARRDVADAFRLLAGSGDVPLCDVGGKDSKTVEALRAEFTQGDGLLDLGSAATSFVLGSGLTAIHFTRANRTGDLPRIECWGVVDVVVTGNRTPHALRP